MPITREEYLEAVARLWDVVPLGYGKDLNTVLKYVEYMQERLNGDLTS